jgi:hypothetical protein
MRNMKYRQALLVSLVVLGCATAAQAGRHKARGAAPAAPPAACQPAAPTPPPAVCEPAQGHAKHLRKKLHLALHHKHRKAIEGAVPQAAPAPTNVAPPVPAPTPAPPAPKAPVKA